MEEAASGERGCFAKRARMCSAVGMTKVDHEQARKLICALHEEIQARLLAARARQAATFAQVAAVTAADTIYRIDRVSEEVVLAWFEARWPKRWPVELVMEGIGDDAPVTFPRGTPVAQTMWKCIIDPIDGTRGLMYDKRSAWILTGLAPQRGARTTIADIVVAVMTELPTSKQWRADQISAVRGGGRKGVVAQAVDVRTGRRRKWEIRLSQARDFRHGFASFVKFFPAGKAATATIEEALWRELGIGQTPGSPLVFDDQYISTGGQLFELLAGHDRMIADVRPLIFAQLGLATELTCHPYDICTELILREAGGVLEDAAGGRIGAPLDTTSPVVWVGFANRRLANQVRPILRRLLGC